MSGGLFSVGRSGRANIQTIFSYLVLFFLVAALITEGYVAFMLREKLEIQAEELNRISMRLQDLKKERDILKEEFSYYNKAMGENHDGNSP
jgi:hypothetical protein